MDVETIVVVDGWPVTVEVAVDTEVAVEVDVRVDVDVDVWVAVTVVPGAVAVVVTVVAGAVDVMVVRLDAPGARPENITVCHVEMLFVMSVSAMPVHPAGAGTPEGMGFGPPLKTATAKLKTVPGANWTMFGVGVVVIGRAITCV